MIHASSRRRLLLLLPAVLLLSVLVTACRRSPGGGTPPAAGGAPAGGPAPAANAPAAPATGAYDVETTDIARVLAGMTPSNTKPFGAVFGQPAWREYEAEARARWSSAWTDRFQPLRSWAEGSLAVAAGCPTLLQPFGGADFLVAYLAFPSCDGYLLVGSDPAGQLPTPGGLAAGQDLAFVEDVKQAFPEVFGQKDGGRGASNARRRPETLAALLVQLARLDARILSASRVGIAADGRPLDPVPIREGTDTAAVSLTFEVPGGRPQSLMYLHAGVDDVSIRRQPGMWTFLRLQAPFVTVLAAESGGQGERATLVRKLILEQSRAILQRPGAIPPRLLEPAGWTVSPVQPPAAAARALHGPLTLALRRREPDSTR
jgi:hypothetical protein